MPIFRVLILRTAIGSNHRACLNSVRPKNTAKVSATMESATIDSTRFL